MALLPLLAALLSTTVLVQAQPSVTDTISSPLIPSFPTDTIPSPLIPSTPTDTISSPLIPSTPNTFAPDGSDFGSAVTLDASPSLAAGTIDIDSTPNQIINGVSTNNPGWVVRLIINNVPDGGQSGCGGTLISPDWVVTAAHCVFPTCDSRGQGAGECTTSDMINNAKSVAYLGGSDWTPGSTAASGWTMLKFKRVVIHPQYSAVGGDLKVLNQYDVALIQLSASVPFATIPYMGDASTPSNGKSIISYGWGYCNGKYCTPKSPVAWSYMLQSTTPGVPVVSCSLNAPSADFCLQGTVAGLTAAICQGDSGGPNTLNINGKEVLVGVTSWSAPGPSGGTCQIDPVPAGLISGILRTGSVASFIQQTSGVAPFNPTQIKCNALVLGSGYDTSQCASVNAGSSCTVRCSSNSAITSTYTCGSMGGSLSGTPPTCTIKCAPLSLGSTYDTSNCQSVNAGGTCTVRCAVNSALTSVYTCGSSGGNLVGSLPSCTAPRCSALSLGSLFDTSACQSVAAGSSCIVKCASNPASTSTYRCGTSGGSLVGTQPTCSTVIRCSPLTLASSYDTSNCQAVVAGGTCTVRCASSSTTTTYRCGSSGGTLTGTPPTCPSSGVACGAIKGLDATRYTFNTCNNLAAGARCTVRCKATSVARSSQFTCSANGGYVGTPPVGCPITCDALTVTSRYITNCRNIAVGSKCNVRCNSNTSLSSTYTCSSTTRKYTGRLPTGC